VTEQVKTMRTFGIILLGLTIAFDSLGQATSDQREVSQAVTSFYTWYMGTTKDKRYSEYVKGAKDENGNTKLETTEYFKKLDSLGVVHEEFIKREKLRFKPCDSLLNTVPWTIFSTADAYEYESKCEWLYYYYWTSAQEPHDGVEVLNINVDKNLANAIANVYYGNNKSNGDKVKVYLTKTSGKWLITKMEKVK